MSIKLKVNGSFFEVDTSEYTQYNEETNKIEYINQVKTKVPVTDNHKGFVFVENENPDYDYAIIGLVKKIKELMQ